ncbi:MAG TPA: hypothetical protein VFA07_12775 [Chthonomonadaceae bacterium]|nr:hypothetical protein [Chthonomonadaceae bacterium]
MATIEIKLSLDTEDQARLMARAQQQGLTLELICRQFLKVLPGPWMLEHCVPYLEGSVTASLQSRPKLPLPFTRLI